MEFKDRLKSARRARGLSQKELAQRIFISRSAVAKWENGLGLPSRDSYLALLTAFSLSAEEFPLHEEADSVSVEKNRKKHLLFSLLFYTVLLLLTVLPFVLLHAIENGYGFTSDMAAGEVWADESSLQNGKYTVYYSTVGDESPILLNFCVTRRVAIGYQKTDPSPYARKVYTAANEVYGTLYSFPVKDGYFHIFRSTRLMIDGFEGVQLHLLNNLSVGGVTVDVFANSYFETPYAITDFAANGMHFTVR